MPIRWTGRLGGKEKHVKILDVFRKKYKRFDTMDGYGSIEYDALKHVPRIIQVDVQIGTSKKEIIWIEAETNFDQIYFKACRIGFSILYLLQNRTPDYDHNKRNIPTEVIFLALYNPVTRFMMSVLGLENRKLFTNYLQDVINLCTLNIKVELYIVDINKNSIMNFREKSEIFP
ncbi:hypothetical protein LCGC14_1193400 [marine sediment metagenome]|uniref:Uncharacterized protein n=1 Tax=marine sediment metagenome TaxID=412755 RepID=A0A0F9P1G4_9ZZZZ